MERLGRPRQGLGVARLAGSWRRCLESHRTEELAERPRGPEGGLSPGLVAAVLVLTSSLCLAALGLGWSFLGTPGLKRPQP